MFTSVTISAHHVWEDLDWHVTAVWREDADSEPLALTASGKSDVTGVDDPIGLLQAAVNALKSQRTVASRRHGQYLPHGLVPPAAD